MNRLFLYLWSLLPRNFHADVGWGEWYYDKGISISINEYMSDRDFKVGFLLTVRWRGRAIVYGWLVSGMQLAIQGNKKLWFVAGDWHRAMARVRRAVAWRDHKMNPDHSRFGCEFCTDEDRREFLLRELWAGLLQFNPMYDLINKPPLGPVPEEYRRKE